MIGSRMGFFWPWPPDSILTDEAVAGLVGQTGDFSVFGFHQGAVKVKEATNLPERKGVWLLVERVPEVRFSIATDQVHPDALRLLLGHDVEDDLPSIGFRDDRG